jgi:hypothetical protein
MTEKSTLKWGPKQLLNRRKVPKTKGSASNGRKSMANEISENGDLKTLINRGLKNPKHDKRASCIGDG